MKMKNMKKRSFENFRGNWIIPKSINYWSYFYVAPGWCDEKIHCYFAGDLEKSILEGILMNKLRLLTKL